MRFVRGYQSLFRSSSSNAATRLGFRAYQGLDWPPSALFQTMDNILGTQMPDAFTDNRKALASLHSPSLMRDVERAHSSTTSLPHLLLF
jgi:hypothetical protein